MRAILREEGYVTEIKTGRAAELLQRLFGERVTDAFRAPFVPGDPERLLSLCADAGLPTRKSRGTKGQFVSRRSNR